jgi:arylsulfatase A
VRAFSVDPGHQPLNMRFAHSIAVALTALVAFAPTASAATSPNLVIILCDDLGYGDLACYGNTKIRTPHLDRLAAEGVRFTDFYCAGAQCTPSRAGMLTGRYPARFGLTHSLMTDAGAGIPASETLLPEALKQRGYATMLAGKWHLGDRPEYHPLRHGYDHFAGLLRGHDTDPREFWQDDKVIDRQADLAPLTSRYIAAAEQFIAVCAKKKQPFFLMLAHTSPHTPLAPGPAFRGRSAGGAYGDCVEEIDDSVGRLLAALKQGGVDRDTLIFFSSDNGPAVDKGPEGGSTGPLRAGKFSTFEGGVRVPAIAWMPDRIKPRVEHRPAILLDVFSTFVSAAGGKPPAGRAIDGKDLSRTLFEAQAREGDEFFFYFRDKLEAHRSGLWKLKLAADPASPPMLFDLSKDPGESTDLAGANPAIVRRLHSRMRDFESSLRRE